MKLERKRFQKKPHLTRRVLEKKVYAPKRRVSTEINHERDERIKYYSSRKTFPNKMLGLVRSLFSH